MTAEPTSVEIQQNYREIYQLFAGAAKARATPGTFMTDREWTERGIKYFSKRVFPFLRSSTVKSVDELTNILCIAGVAGGPNEANQFIQKLYGRRLDYGIRTLYFTQVQNRNQKEACRIERRIQVGADD